MIEEQARVERVVDGKAILEFQRQSGCHSCQMNGVCGTGSLGRLIGFRPKPLTIDNRQNLKVGDLVTLGIEENALLQAGLLTYLLPLLGLMLAAVVAELWLGNDLVSSVAALLGLLAGFRGAAWISRQRLSQRLEPRVIRPNLMNQ